MPVRVWNKSWFKECILPSCFPQHHKQVMVVSVYCPVIFYADKGEARREKCLPRYGFCPTSARGPPPASGAFTPGFFSQSEVDTA